MDINGVTSGPGAVQGASGDDLDKTAFMTLLVAQLQNQDPMEPMSNSEFVAQLAQFSSVEQLTDVNEGIQLLQMQQLGAANVQAASFVGKEIEVSSNKLQVGDSDETINTTFRLDAAAETVTLNIRDSSGSVVRTVELGPNEKGEVVYEWDCENDNGVRVPNGTYRIDVVAEDDVGNSVTWDARFRGVVDGVSYENGYPELRIGDIRASVGDITSIFSAED